jgi:pectate lyase
MTELGTLVRSGGTVRATSLLAAYNAVGTPAIGTDAGWTPALHTTVLPAIAVPFLVTATAGTICLPT